MSKGKLNLDVGPLREEEPPAFKIESLTTYFEKPSYTVLIRTLDWKKFPFPFRINTSISELQSLIKYSEEQYSPVSATPTDYLQLGTPPYFQSFKSKGNSELMADDRESAYAEKLKWGRVGSPVMESMKNHVKSSFYGVANNFQLEITWADHNVFMYCTSITPNTSLKRKLQRECLSADYDFGTRIASPSCFATQLGYEFGKQVDFEKKLKPDPPGWHLINAHLRRQSECFGEHLIHVDHGPVCYLPEEKIERMMNRVFDSRSSQVLPFLKRTGYQGQQEYRFVITVQFQRIANHKGTENQTFLLKVSDKLRNLMTPLKCV